MSDASDNCLQTLSVSLAPPNVSIESDIFEAVAGMLDATAEAGTPPTFVTNKLNNVDLNVDIAGVGSAALQQPVFTTMTPPFPSSPPPPSLTRASYEALQSVISYVHTSPVIQDIFYPEFVDAVGTLLDAPRTPPLDYPQEDLFPTENWAQAYHPVRPTLAVQPDPAWVPIQRRDFVPLGVEKLSLGLENLIYEPPDVANMAQRAELVYEDDADLRQRLTAIIQQTDDEVSQWLLRSTQEYFLAVALRTRKSRVSKDIEKLFEGVAARNFALPSGAVDAAVDEIVQAELDEKYAAIQQAREEVYAAGTSAVVSSMQQSLKIERNHQTLFMRYARQNLQVYKLNLQLATTAYESVLGIYDRIVQALNTEVEAYNQYVGAVQAQNSALGEQASLMQAIVQSFLAKVQTYSTRIDVKKAATDVVSTDVKLQTMDIQAYVAGLKAALANVSVMEQNIDSFRKAIKAHSDSFKWYDEAMAAFETWLSAKTSAIEVNEEKVKSYSKLWSSEDRRISAFSDYISSSMSQMETEIQRYKDAVRAQREYLSGISQAANASVQMVTSYADTVRNEQGYIRDYNSASIAFQSAKYSQEIAAAKTELAQQSIDAEAEAQFARIEAAKASSLLTSAGALAQAAASIMQVSLSARGSTSENVSGQDSGAVSSSIQNSRSWRKACRSSYNYSENAPE